MMPISKLALAACLAAVPAVAHADDERNSASVIVVTGTPTAQEAADRIDDTPGAVEVISAEEFRDTPAQHIKDILAYAPGVSVQPRMGDDARISIRGSGLSRAYGARGFTLLIDGVPMNTSDGLIDFFEIDPTAYDYVEVYRGANALRYGANTLGGAINLVTPTGREASPFTVRLDGGSFGYIKTQAGGGGAAGPLDWFATGSYQSSDGYRDHSNGDALRGNLNLGYRLSDSAETRLYVTGASTNQRIPGEVSKAQALGDPRSANPVWVAQDQQRNVDSLRLSSKTTVRFGPTAVEFGAFYNHRHVDHPIYQYLDYTVDDYGGFIRAVDERRIGGMDNRLVLGANLLNGSIDTDQYVNTAATKGALTASYLDQSKNFSAYAENSLSLSSGVTVIGGIQYLHASRSRRDRFLDNGNQSGKSTFDLWSPRIGLLWEATPQWQIFANVSRSAEVPTYDANSFASPASSDLDAQRATTYEIGTRGSSGVLGWDVAFYRADIRDELQCVTAGPFAPCAIVNANRTVHQGVEAGFNADIPLSGSGSSLDLRAAYTYADFHFDRDALFGDKELPGLPHHLLRAEVLYRHASGLYAGPSIEWAPGHYFADNANSLTVDPYALLGVRAGYDRDGRWSLYLEGRNLADKAYISTVAIAGTATETSELFNPGTGRAVFAGFRIAM